MLCCCPAQPFVPSPPLLFSSLLALCHGDPAPLRSTARPECAKIDTEPESTRTEIRAIERAEGRVKKRSELDLDPTILPPILIIPIPIAIPIIHPLRISPSPPHNPGHKLRLLADPIRQPIRVEMAHFRHDGGNTAKERASEGEDDVVEDSPAPMPMGEAALHLFVQAGATHLGLARGDAGVVVGLVQAEEGHHADDAEEAEGGGEVKGPEEGRVDLGGRGG